MRVIRSRAIRVLALALLGLHSMLGAGQPTPPQAGAERQVAALTFAVVRVKPSTDSEADDWGIGVRGRNFWAVHVTAGELIAWAYGVNARQVEHAPDWISRERFDVDGLPEAGVQPTREQYRTMVQATLSDRFSLRFRPSQKVLPVYVLSVAAGGLRVSQSADPQARSTWGVHRGWLSIQNMTFADAAKVMQRTIFDRPVLDRTGLRERYSFLLKWRADETQFTQMQGMDVPEEGGTADVDDIYTAARRQLGIQIEARKDLAPTMIIESIAHPSPN